MRPFVFAVAFSFFALGAQAQEPTPPAMCLNAFDACNQACARANADSAAGRTGCEARCAAERGACEARAAVNTAKPWVMQQMEQARRFLEGFMSGPTDRSPAPAPAPTPDRRDENEDGMRKIKSEDGHRGEDT